MICRLAWRGFRGAEALPLRLRHYSGDTPNSRACAHPMNSA
jgi:hypothetical protein